MENYKILNHLEDVVKIVNVKNEDEVKDIILDLKNYHGFYSVFTYEKA